MNELSPTSAPGFNFIPAIDVQFLNALSPIDVQLKMLLFVKLVHPANANGQIETQLLRLYTVLRLVQL